MSEPPAISELHAFLAALAQTAAENLASPQSGVAAAHLNAAARSMGWLRRVVETDDEAHMVMVALQSALHIGASLEPKRADALMAAFQRDRTRAAVDAITTPIPSEIQNWFEGVWRARPELRTLTEDKIASRLVGKRGRIVTPPEGLTRAMARTLARHALAKGDS